MLVCMHGLTSSGFDFRTVMEGWAKAGIRLLNLILCQPGRMKKPGVKVLRAN